MKYPMTVVAEVLVLATVCIVGIVVAILLVNRGIAKQEEALRSRIYTIDSKPMKLLCIFVAPEHPQWLYRVFEARRRYWYDTGLTTCFINDPDMAAMIEDLVYYEASREWVAYTVSADVMARFVEVTP
jgi:hypothetical protein